MFKIIIECEDWTYGYKCVNNCSGHCLHNSVCNKQTGHCNGGCSPGYTNDDCSKGNFTHQCLYITKNGGFFSV